MPDNILGLLIAFDECGVKEIHRQDGNIICFFRHEGKRRGQRFQELVAWARNSGLKDKLLPMLSPLPRGVVAVPT